MNISSNIIYENGKYIVYSGLPEFGYELISILPYCYYLYNKGLLSKTISGYDTKCLYFFSNNHIEINKKRSYDAVKQLEKNRFPNISIHKNQLDWNKFLPPPFKSYYKNEAIKFQKPTVVITNRYSEEWGGEPINFINEKCIKELITILYKKYQIVIIDPIDFPNNYEDHQRRISLKYDYNFLHKHNVITLQDLKSKYSSLTYNEILCRLFAGSERFITSNGGLGIFASFFSGENLIFSKRCRELDPDINSFYAWYYRLSGSICKVINTEEDLINIVKSKWIDNDILFNILIRTSKRKNYFHDCICSVLDQNYLNYNILISIDDVESIEYVKKFPCSIVTINKTYKEINPPKRNDNSYGIYFKYNNYFNEMHKYVNNGYVIYLDDDDKLVHTNVLSELNQIIKNSNCDLIFWRVQFPNRLVPNDNNWRNRVPICCDISTIGFCFKAKMKPRWEPFKRGDFRVANYLFNKSDNVIWHNKILTSLQRVKEDGFGLRDDKSRIMISNHPELNIIVPAYKAKKTLKTCLDSILSNFVNNNCLKYNVWIGIDGCKDTFLYCKHLNRYYNSNFHFFMTKQNYGTYLIKNSLLKKVSRRDSLVLFFDSDDIMPQNFISNYYNLYCNLLPNEKLFILRTYCFGVHDSIIKSFDENIQLTSLYDIKNLLQVNKTFDALQLLLPHLLYNKYQHNLSYLFYYLYRFFAVKYNKTFYFDDDTFTLKQPHGAFFVPYNLLEELGCFYSHRVGQDTNFLDRAKASNIKLISGIKHIPFIRRISDTSLTHSKDFGRESHYRKSIQCFNESVIKNKQLIAPWDYTELFQIL